MEVALETACKMLMLEVTKNSQHERPGVEVLESYMVIKFMSYEDQESLCMFAWSVRILKIESGCIGWLS